MDKNTANSAIQPKNQHALTSLEIIFNRFFAILLLLSTLPLYLNILNIPTMAVFGVFVLFLWFGKKYHLFTNFFFFLFALGVYFVPLPISWGVFQNLKEVRLSGFNFYSVASVFSISPLIFVTFAFRNVLGHIFSYFKASTARRNVFYLTSLLIVFTLLIAYPFLDSIKLRERAMENDSGDSRLAFILTTQELKETGSSSALWRNYTARLDEASHKYVYRLNLADPLSESLVFTAVKTDWSKINFITDTRVTCSNCQKDENNPFGLVFPAGKSIDFIITSNQLIQVINFTETGDKTAEFVFWR